MKELNKEDFPLILEKDLGMLFPTPTSKGKKRYAMFICPCCTLPYKAYVNDVKTGKSTKCKQCRTEEQSTAKANIVAGVKKCGTCNITKPLDLFYNSISSGDGKGSRCKPCDSIARKQWTTNNPAKAKQSSRNRGVLHKYGITQDKYLAMFKQQDGKCAICSTTDNKGKSFSIDHCHETGTIRGLLCNQCNRGIGMLGDTASTVLLAYEYLKGFEKSQTH